MASSEYGALVGTELTALNINTQEEVRTLRTSGFRHSGNMKTILDNIATARGSVWVSRKRVRSDALRLFNEGAL